MNALRFVSALGYGGIGVLGLQAPDRLLEIFGGTAPTPAARNEIRAAYGGLPLGIAVLALRGGPSARSAALLSGCMAAARAYGVSREEQPVDPRTRLSIGVESALAAGLLLGSGRKGKRGA